MRLFRCEDVLRRLKRSSPTPSKLSLRWRERPHKNGTEVVPKLCLVRMRGHPAEQRSSCLDRRTDDSHCRRSQGPEHASVMPRASFAQSEIKDSPSCIAKFSAADDFYEFPLRRKQFVACASAASCNQLPEIFWSSFFKNSDRDCSLANNFEFG